MTTPTIADIERIANRAQALGWPVADALTRSSIAVTDHTDTLIRIELDGEPVWLSRHPATGVWHQAHIASDYTRDRNGQAVTVTPVLSLNGRPMTAAEADLAALYETARSGCTSVYRATPAGGVR